MMAESATAASPENPQVVRGDTYEDYYGAFTLNRPHKKWQFLTEEKALEANPDATMVMTSSLGGFLAVVVETMDGVTLDDYADLILSPTSLLGQGAPRTDEVIGGQRAIRKAASADIGGTGFEYRAAILQRGDFNYQLIGWGTKMGFSKHAADIEAIMASFRFVEDREPAIRPILTTPDGQGFGWAIRDRVYQSAISGLTLTCPEACRLPGADELREMSEDASLGVIGGLGEFYQTWTVEDGNGGEALRAWQEQQTLEALSGEEAGRREVVIGGMTATEVAFRGFQGEIPFTYRHASFLREGYLYRIFSWWEGADDAKKTAVLPLLEASYEAASWMPEVEREALKATLIASDPGNAVGADFAMRGGIYRDFAADFTLTLPPSGLFETRTLAQGDEISNEGASRLTIDDLERGPYYEIDVMSLDGETHEEAHGRMLEDLDTGSTDTQTFAGEPFLVTPYRTLLADGVEATSLYLSNATSGMYMGMDVTQMGHDAAALRERVGVMLEGFKREPVETRHEGEQEITDHRLGYRVRVPSGWTIKPLEIPQIANLGSAVVISHGRVGCGVVAVCSPLGVDLELAVNGVLNNIGVRLDPTTEKRSKGTLAGLEADHRTVEGRQGLVKTGVHVWTAKRANTGYIVYVIDPGQQVNEANAAKIAKCLSLLEP